MYQEEDDECDISPPDEDTIKSPYDFLDKPEISGIIDIFCDVYKKSQGSIEKLLDGLKKECNLTDGINVSISNKKGILLKFNYKPDTDKVEFSNVSTPDEIYQTFLDRLPEKYKQTTTKTD